MALKQNSKQLLLLGVILLYFCLVGWGETWEDIGRDTAKVTTIQAEFIQHKHLKILTKPLISQGLFYYRKPDAVRWEYSTPVKSILLMNRGNIRRFTLSSQGMVEDASQALSSMQVVVQEIGLWSQGRFRESEYFRAELKPEGGTPKIILTPKEEAFSAIISRIEIVPSGEQQGAIKSVKIIESEGNFTLLEFKNVRINEKIDETVFRYTE